MCVTHCRLTWVTRFYLCILSIEHPLYCHMPSSLCKPCAVQVCFSYLWGVKLYMSIALQRAEEEQWRMHGKWPCVFSVDDAAKQSTQTSTEGPLFFREREHPLTLCFLSPYSLISLAPAPLKGLIGGESCGFTGEALSQLSVSATRHLPLWSGCTGAQVTLGLGLWIMHSLHSTCAVPSLSALY